MSRARLLFSLAIFAAACAPSVPVEEGHRFRCDAGSGAGEVAEEGVCADGWVCRLDGRCHEAGEGAPFSCRGDEHCGQGWRCGRAGRCQALGVGGEYPCGTAADCEAGWRCGAAGLCFDPAGPASAVACASDEQCVAAARCGLEATCHLRGEVGPYLCFANEHCEGGWRCAYTGRCLDPSGDALVTTGDGSAAVAVRRVSPGWDQTPLQLAATERLVLGTEARRGFAILLPDGVLHFDRSESSVVRPDGGPLRVWRRRFAPLPAAQVAAISATLDSAWIVTHNGGLLELHDDGDGGAAVTIRAALPGRSLRPAAPDGTRVFTAATDAPAEWDLSGAAPTSSPLTLPSFGPDGGTQHVFDLGLLPARGAAPECVVALGTEGVFLAPRDDAGFVLSDGGRGTAAEFRPASAPAFPSTFCHPTAPDGGFRAVRAQVVQGGSSTYVAVHAVRTDGAPGDYVAIWGGGAALPVSPSCPPPAACANGALGASVSGPCLACPFGGRMRDFYAPAEESGQVQVICETLTDAGQSSVSNLRVNPGGPCEYIPLENLEESRSRTPDPVLLNVARASPTLAGARTVLAGAHGELSEFQTYEFAASVMATGRLRAAFNPDGGAPRAIAEDDVTAILREEPGIGLVPDVFSGSLDSSLGAVAGRPDWVIQDDRLLDLPTLMAGGGTQAILAQSTVFIPNLPGTATSGAATVVHPDGGVVVVSFRHDRLNDAVPQRSDAGIPPLTLRRIPDPAVPIIGLVLDEVAEGGGHASGWVMTPASVYRLHAPTAEDFRLSKVSLPEGDWVRVFGDGLRQRVGYTDGRVVSLPGTLTLAPPLGTDQAFDFEELCGRPFALGADDVYVLETPASGAARWRPLGVRALLARTAAESPLEGGKLQRLGGQLWVEGRFGQTAVLGYEGGCSP